MEKCDIKIYVAVAIGQVLTCKFEDDESNAFDEFESIHIKTINNYEYYLKETANFRVELTACECNKNENKFVIAEYNLFLPIIALVNNLAEAIYIYNEYVVS